MPERHTEENRTVIVQFRYPPERADILQLIADAEHGGNVSALLRGLADEKIASRMRRRAEVAQPA